MKKGKISSKELLDLCPFYSIFIWWPVHQTDADRKEQVITERAENWKCINLIDFGALRESRNRCHPGRL